MDDLRKSPTSNDVHGGEESPKTPFDTNDARRRELAGQAALDCAERRSNLSSSGLGREVQIPLTDRRDGSRRGSDFREVIRRLIEIERAIGVLDALSIRRMIIEIEDYVLRLEKEVFEMARRRDVHAADTK